jgi:hypothetical protein
VSACYSRRYLRALWRDTRVLVHQFRTPLLAFLVLLGVGTLALRCFYTNPESGQRLGWTESLYSVFTLVFLQPVLPFPRAPGLQLLFILTPLVGLALVADGIVHFGMALFDRRERKEAWQVAIASTYHNLVFASLESLARLREMSGESQCSLEESKNPRRPWLKRLFAGKESERGDTR